MEDVDIDTRFSLIANTVTETAENIAPKERTIPQKSKEDIEIEELDMKRKKLREITNKTDAQKIDYQETVKLVRKKRRQRKRRKKREQIESILEIGKGPKQILKVNSNKTRISNMKTKEILNICAEFYQELYGSNSKQECVFTPKVYLKAIDPH